MIIAISGLAGSGKTTVGHIVSERMSFKLVSPSFKDIAEKEGTTLLDIQKRAERDNGALDKAFDNAILDAIKGENAVVCTWLGPWIIKRKDVLRVWLFASEHIRAKRVADRDNISFTNALNLIREREESNRRRYKKYYGIDIDDLSIFDICINAGLYTPKMISDIIIHVLNVKFGTESNE